MLLLELLCSPCVLLVVPAATLIPVAACNDFQRCEGLSILCIGRGTYYDNCLFICGGP